MSLLVPLAACGGDFEYKISGDRTESDQRAGMATSADEGSTAPSQADLLKLQADYAKKVEAANAAKATTGGR